MLVNPFAEIAAILLIAAVIGFIGRFLRQPLIVSFIGVGILVGPAGLGIVTHHEQIDLLASFGISLLLFVVGLKLDLTMVRTLGPVALATGIGQIVFTSVIGFAIALALGMTTLTATYVAVALTFSSTIIIVKLLSDKREIDALHGRIAVGFLIVQDVAVIVAMIGITALGAETAEGQSLAARAAVIFASGIGFVVVIAALAVWVLPRAAASLARTPELLVLSAIAWAIALAAAGDLLGFSKEVGAFLAGASLAPTQFRDTIGSRLATVRDFLLLFFFIELGARLDLALLGMTLGAAVVFSLFVLIGNPIIVMVIMGAMGYRKRTSFLAGLTVAQISEFSLILAALGVSVGHIGAETMGLITTVGLITIGLSTYMIIYSAQLYERLAPWLGIFERRAPYREAGTDIPPHEAPDVIVFGLGRYGSGIVRHLRLRNRRVMGVDFDPGTLAHWRDEGVPVVYGDAHDADLFEHVPLDGVSWVVSTAPDLETSRVLLHHLRDRGYDGKIAVSARSADDGDLLRLEGVDVLLRPYADAAEQAADAITSAMDQLSAVADATPGLREVRLTPGSVWAGHRIEEVPVRDEFGVTVLAVSRAGRSFFNPGPEFQLFPGDRLILSGDPTALDRAMEYLGRIEPVTDPEEEFTVREVSVSSIPGWEGRTLVQLELPARHGITVVAATRGDRRLAAPDPHRTLSAGDRLVLAGTAESIAKLLKEVA